MFVFASKTKEHARELMAAESLSNLFGL